MEANRGMRVRLMNIPPIYGVSQIRKFVAKHLELPTEAIVCRKGPKWNYAMLTFRPTNGLPVIPPLESLRERLAGAQWKTIRLDAKLEEMREDPVLAAKAEADAAKESGSEVQREKNLNDQVTPLWKMSYGEQLSLKQDKLQRLLTTKLSNSQHLFEPIKASPNITGYRNKCEFTIALDRQGQPTAGFLLGGYREGIVTVENARETLHTPDVLKRLADHLQVFVRGHTEAPFTVYDRSHKSGFWRLMLARVHDGDVMAAVQISSPRPGEETPEERAKLISLLTEHMKSFGAELKSFFIQESSGVHHGVDQKAPFKLIFGSETLTQSLSGLKFRISPLSFFQVNQGATEILYDVIKDYVLSPPDSDNITTSHGIEETTEDTPLDDDKVKEVDNTTIDCTETILLDLCCGTGTIGMTLAAYVRRVIGVELVKEAINDAKLNVHDNQIENIEFICDRVESAIDKIISTLPPQTPIVVVLDPPRNGVHSSVIKAIRRCSRVGRLVFVACNAEASVTNFVDLTRPCSKSLIGAPFKLKKAVAVDLFPMTEHCELVLQFHRTTRL